VLGELLQLVEVTQCFLQSHQLAVAEVEMVVAVLGKWEVVVVLGAVVLQTAPPLLS
jgi:hypothetical protein